MGDREATRALEALAAAYLAAFSSLQTAASFASARLVRQLLADGPSEQAMDRLAALWPGLLVPTQERVGRLAEAQLLRQAEVLEMLEAGEPLTGRARSIEPGLPATLVTAQTPSMRSPGLRMNRLLAAELEFSEALDAAGRYGENVAATALRASERAGLDDGYKRHWRSKSPLRWKRVTHPGACGWCQLVADKLYSDVAGMDNPGWHGFCRCSWRVATSTEAKEFSPEFTGEERKDVVAEPAKS